MTRFRWWRKSRFGDTQADRLIQVQDRGLVHFVTATAGAGAALILDGEDRRRGLHGRGEAKRDSGRDAATEGDSVCTLRTEYQPRDITSHPGYLDLDADCEFFARQRMVFGGYSSSVQRWSSSKGLPSVARKMFWRPCPASNEEDGT